MRKRTRIISMLLLLGFSATAQHQYEIKFRSHSFTPPERKAETNQRQSRTGTAPGYYLVQFEDIPDKKQRELLTLKGIELLNYVPDMTYEAYVSKRLSSSDLDLAGVRSMVKVPAESKLSLELGYGKIPAHARSGSTAIDVDLFLYKPEDRNLVEESLKNTKAKVIGRDQKLTVRIDKEHVKRLAQIEEVRFIDFIPAPFTVYLNGVISGQKASVLRSVLAGERGLTGKGVNIGVGDNGFVENHLDFQQRLTNMYQDINEGMHQDHVSGILAGAGNMNARYQGVAPGAVLYTDRTHEIINNAVANLQQKNIVITNNSYGVICAVKAAGTYDSYSVLLDNQVADEEEILHVIASGNEATLNCTPSYSNGFVSVSSGIQSAKNALTVGNVDKNNVIHSMSSKGPTLDGRIKPEVVGIGTDVTSTIPYNSYVNASGTSMATPAVTGTLALLHQRYSQLHNGDRASGALLKAVVCNTADDLGNPGPDFTYGFGKINALKAVQTLENQTYFTEEVDHNAQKTFSISVPSGAKELKAMLYWHDPAGSPSASNALVNNLNLRVVNNGIQYSPWVLDPTNFAVDNPAVRGIDYLNNIEQVTITNPTAGTTQLLVDGFIVPSGPQRFYLVYEVITSGITLTYPYGGESLVPGETIPIQWEAAGNGDMTAEYSLDNGASWTTIANGINASDRKYDWVVPAAVSGEAKIRVTDGVYAGESIGTFSIAGIPQNVTLITDCGLTGQLSWDTLAGAVSYNVYMLSPADTVMQIVANVHTTSYQLTTSQVSPDNWFAVQAVLADSGKSLRSVAIRNITRTVSNLPYSESFDLGTGSWIVNGYNSSWQHGAPAGTIITGTSEAWVTNLTGDHNPNELSYIESGCFDVSEVTEPVYFSFQQYLALGSSDQAAFVDYTNDGGITWQRLGDNTSGISNWYTANHPVVGYAWTNQNAAWRPVVHRIETSQFGADKVLKFRIGFYSGSAAGISEGIGVDDFRLDITDPSVPVICSSGSTFQYMYAENSYSHFTDIAHTSDGGYIATGTARPYEPVYVNSGIVVTKFDQEGQIDWAQTFSRGIGFFASFGDKVLPVSDGYVVSALWQLQPMGIPSGSIIKFGLSGDVLWSYNINHPTNKMLGATITGMLEDTDKGIVVTGQSGNSGDTDIFAAKFDRSGKLLWIEFYALDGVSEEPSAILPMGNDRYAIVGRKNLQADELVLLIVGRGGELLEYTRTPTSMNTSLNTMERNHGAVLTSDGYIAGFNHAYIYKMDLEGNIVWLKNAGNIITLRELSETSDGYLIAGGVVQQSEPIHQDMIALKVDMNGNLVKAVSIGSEESDEEVRGLAADCSGIVLAGRKSENSFVVRTDNALWGGCDEKTEVPVLTNTLYDSPISVSSSAYRIVVIYSGSYNGVLASDVMTSSCTPQDTTVVEESVEISGIQVICKQSSSENHHTQTYSVVNPKVGATYTWSVSTGSIQSGQGTANATILFPSGTGVVTIEVTESYAGNLLSGEREVSMNIRPSSPGSITGPGGYGAVCFNQQGVMYQVSGSSPGYLWQLPSGSVIASGEGTNTVTVDFGTQPGNITVFAQNGEGCNSYSGSNIWVGPIACGGRITALSEIEELGFAVWPQPASSSIRVQASAPIVNARLMTAGGSTLLDLRGNNAMEISLNVSYLSEGMYILQVQTEDAIYTRQIIISQ